MSKWRVFASLAIAGVPLAPVAPAQELGQKLTAETVRTAVFGHDWDARTSEGLLALIAIANDGSATFSSKRRDGKPINTNGRYFFREGKLCRFWEGLDDGKERCFDAYLNAGNIVLVIKDGQIGGVMTPRQ